MRLPKFPEPAVTAALVREVDAVMVPAVSVPIVAFAAVSDWMIAAKRFAIVAKSEPTSEALVPDAFTNDRFWM